MGLAIALAVYAVATVAVTCILLWRYKREPERRILFLSMFAFWLAVPIVVWLAPPGWMPSEKPGHPSWLNVAILAVLIGATAFESWRRPARRRFYGIVWVPIISALVLLQIVYPLLWER